jgi:ubiquilin
MEPESFQMKLKITTSQQELLITISRSMSLSDLKQECCRVINEETDLKLIFRGKILKESADLSLLQPDQTLYLVKEQKKPSESPAPVPISSGAGNMAGLLHGLNHFGVMNQARSMLNDLDAAQPEDELQMDPAHMAMLSQMMSNPATRDFVMNSMQQMLSNPQMREQLINANPSLRRLAENNPGVFDMMANPMVMEQMKGMMQRMALGNSNGPLSGDVASFPAPGGAPEGARTGESNPQTANTPTLQGGNTGVGMQAPNLGNWGNMMGYNPMAYNPAGFNPMAYNPMAFNPMGYNPMAYNPMAYNPMAFNPMAFNPMGFGNGGGSTAGNLPPQSGNLREVYASQLQSMKEMGFINEETNLRALQATGGNVQAAIDRILGMLGN